MDTFWSWIVAVYNAATIPFNIALIVIVSLILRAILLAVSDRVIRRLVSEARKKNGGTSDHTGPVGVPAAVTASRQVQRTKTMGTVFHNFITWSIVCIASIQILQVMGVSVTAIVATAGIGTAALGFGAQNIIKDVLNGMFMVFEDQLGVGDVVDLGLASGTVESVGLRITTLRGDDGTIWFVRNGEIVRVGNKSYGDPKRFAAKIKKPSAAKKA
ncbi:mechanosensitive ion channel family protein [uncultured Aurantimicrobium sp.]|uniref:mechanosensitive ion channel family protein n=1 Tax=uncultured Aurantimicrobium sp. TaxID=1705357 RepID=UPI00260A70AC|nr:mechanosensitive ion channel domain-containing protein [uncultured Aurantimicrobium sp.]